MIRIFSSVGIAALAVALAPPADAQTPAPEASAPQATGLGSDADAGAIGDIVVTAQKRSESLQKVPLAITAVTAADLTRSGINDLQGVSAVVPNLNLGQQLGVARVALRGIGLENIAAGAEGSIAFHVDGVFVSRSIAALSSFYDIEQVEVLRGPQGTLYGRNATGGSINLTTRGPTEGLSGYADLIVGNYGRVVAEGAIGGAIVPDVLAVRVAFQSQDRDGYGKNIVTANEIDDLRTRAVRGSVKFTPTDRLTLNIKADYYWQKDHSGGYHYLGQAGFDANNDPITPFGLAYGGSVASNVRDISGDIDPRNYVKFWGISSNLAYDLGGDTELRSITAYRRTNYTTQTDLDLTSAPLTPITQFERDKQFSQEFQLSGKSDRLTWLAGVYYFHEDDLGGQRIPFNNYIVGFPAPGTQVQGFFGGGFIKTEALAAFGQASYEVVDNLRLTLGARYSWEKKVGHEEFMFDFLTPYDPSLPPVLSSRDLVNKFKKFTPRVAVDYQISPGVLIYASWSKGFKAGTYNLGTLDDGVNPENISAFEAGIKSSMFDRRLRLNLAGFYYDYKDLQVGKVASNLLVLENAATAEIYGLEAELQAKITPQFEINANGAWLHARFKSYCSADASRPALGQPTAVGPCEQGEIDLSGNTLSQSPEFTFFVGAQYTIPSDVGSFTLRGEIAWRDQFYYTPFNRREVGQDAVAKLNAFLNWESGNEEVSASLFVKNLTDKTTYGPSYVSTGLVGYGIIGYLEDPRTYGVRVGFKF